MGPRRDGREKKKRSAERLTAKSKVWLEVGDRFAVGDGGIDLLDAIRRHGSLRQAAVHVGWSYRHAWDYLRRMETAFGRPLSASRPGRPHEGCDLTRFGEQILQALTSLKEAVRAETERAFLSRFRMRLTRSSREHRRVR
jgi:molybdate transport system regulatory protein